VPEHLIHIPRWYPNRFDPQLGIFVEKHIRISSSICKCSLVYSHPDPSLSDFDIHISEEKGFPECIIYYPQSKNSVKNLRNYRRAIELGVEHILGTYGHPDLIHFHVHLSNILEGKRALPNIPYVVTEHWSGYVDDRFNQYPPWKKVLIKRHLKRAQNVGCPSRNMVRILKGHLTQPNILHVPNLIERGNEEQVDSFEKVFLTVGDLDDAHKNMSGLIRAFAQSNLNDWKLRIIGDGKDRAMLEELAVEMKIDDRIEFLGRLENKRVLNEMKQIQFFVLNSNYESFGMVPAEALMAGKPVISTSCGGPEEYINEDNGILIPINNEPALVNALEEMSTIYAAYNPQSLIDSVEDQYGEEAVRNALEALYSIN